VIPLSLTFGNPDLLDAVGLGPLLKGLAAERQYKNDEQFDNQLRSILFQIPKDFTSDCLDVPDPNCFNVVSDLGAIDVARARDHGIPLYNDVRAAFGLPRLHSFTEVTGELTEAFPPGLGPDDRGSLEFTQLRDRSGNLVDLADEDEAVEAGVQGLRGSTLAARLESIYGSVDNMDAFVGMVSERHVTGSELGPLQLAIWKDQFVKLRDGDRFFYGNDDAFLLGVARDVYHVDYRRTLAQVIVANSNTTVQANVFKAPIDPASDTIGVVASYGFDESGGQVADDSGWGNTGTTRDTVPVPGKFGNALSFNGSSSWVAVPGSGSLDLTWGATLEAWAKPTAMGTRWMTVVFKEQPGGMIYSLYAAEGTGHPLGQIAVGGERNVRGPGSLPLNTWSHLATTFDGTTQTLYVNGEPVATNAQNGPVDLSEGTLRIGGNSIWGEWFKGAIDEVRVYNRPLSEEEIGVDMATPIAAFQPHPPVAPALIGESHVQLDSNPLRRSGGAEAFPTQVAADGTIANLHLYVDHGTTAARLILGVYSDNGGHPGDLLTTGTLTGPVPDAWNTVTVPAVDVDAGETVWIAVLGRGGLLGYRDLCCTASSPTPTETHADTALTALPATWTTGAVYDDGPIAAYGSG
jgi:concanavalin A-like lectin/glucanase superfamily protein/heme peroxidase